MTRPAQPEDARPTRNETSERRHHAYRPAGAPAEVEAEIFAGYQHLQNQ